MGVGGAGGGGEKDVVNKDVMNVKGFFPTVSTVFGVCQFTTVMKDSWYAWSLFWS